MTVIELDDINSAISVYRIGVWKSMEILRC